MVHASNPSRWEAEDMDQHELMSTLGYAVSARPA